VRSGVSISKHESQVRQFTNGKWSRQTAFRLHSDKLLTTANKSRACITIRKLIARIHGVNEKRCYYRITSDNRLIQSPLNRDFYRERSNLMSSGRGNCFCFLLLPFYKNNGSKTQKLLI